MHFLVEVQGAVPPPLRILLAEDNPVNQKVAQLLLGKLGHRVDTVDNGLDAVDAALAGTYDLVLMDVQMPQLDGLAATRRIRAELPGRQPTIIAVTASGLLEHQAACVTAGMDACLAKPLRVQALRAALASVCRGGATAGSDPDGLLTPGDPIVSAPAVGSAPAAFSAPAGVSAPAGEPLSDRREAG